LIWSGPFTAPGTIGRDAFNGLVAAAFLLCCAACVLTADTISSERREGTLGLLLLTRVRHFDVMVGKFASSGLMCLAGLVAFLPVLALPLLTGGVTGGEAMRKAVALFNALFLALSVGLWASARGFERFQTARAAFLSLAGLVLGPVLLGLFLPDTHVGIASPLGAISQAADVAYKTSSGRYWLSLVIVQIIAWAFLLSAMVSMRSRAGDIQNEANDRAVQTNPQSAGSQATLPRTPAPVAESWSMIKSAAICRYCGRLNEVNAVWCQECGTLLHPKELYPTHHSSPSSEPTPLHWLLRRQRGLKPMLWLAGLIGFFHFVLFGMVGRLFIGGVGMQLFGIAGALGLTMAALTGSIFAWVASRFFVEARRTGELELLLTTPLGAEELVSAQWDILKRLIRWPVLVMMLPGAMQGAFFMLSYNAIQSDLWTLYYALSQLLSVSNIILSAGALCWLAVWFGLRVPGQAKAILWTVLLAVGVPYALSLLWSILYRPVLMFVGGISAGTWFGSPWLLGYLIPPMATVLFYLWLIRLARSQLLHELSGAEPLEPRKIFSLSNLLPRVAAAIRRARQWPPV
jgi:hypothetical protein